MVGESLAIIIVIAVMAVMYLRAGKLLPPLLALPLIGLPVAHLVGVVLWGPPIVDKGSIPPDFTYRCIALLAGLVASVALCAVFSAGLPSKKSRLSYLVFAGIFSVGLALAYLLYLL